MVTVTDYRPAWRWAGGLQPRLLAVVAALAISLVVLVYAIGGLASNSVSGEVSLPWGPQGTGIEPVQPAATGPLAAFDGLLGEYAELRESNS